MLDGRRNLNRNGRGARCLRIELLENRELPSAAPIVSAPRDDYGNTFAGAAAIALSKNGSGNRAGVIEAAGDVDMFRVVASKSGVMTVTPKSSSRAVDALLQIYDGAKHLVAADKSGLRAQLPVRVKAGSTYYVAVSSPPGTTGDYCLNRPGLTGRVV